MLRTTHRLLLAALFLGLTPGCTAMFTKRSIERFSESMQSQSLEGLRQATSSEFEQQALRQDDSAKGLKMLKIPTGKIEVVSVEELEKGKRKVLVKVGEKKQTKDLEYILVKNKGSWVVDDITLKQDSGGGLVVERSVAEQMDLLLTCREFLISWREGTRDEKLAFCDDKLRTMLNPIPEKWFEKLSKEIAGPGNQSTFRPDARLNGNRAFVSVPHPQGNLLLQLNRTGTEWKVSDLAVEQKSRESTGIRSLNHLAEALILASNFLTAYESVDRPGLQKTGSPSFYKNCLVSADLKELPMPVEAMLENDYEARQFTDGTERIQRVEMLFRHADSTYMLTLRSLEPALENGTTGSARFFVDEVTLFDKNERDVRRLSSVFMTQSIVGFYVEALVNRDERRLKEMSSTTFSTRVWSRPEARHFGILAEPDLQKGELKVLNTVYRGDTTEVTVDQAGTPLTLILKSSSGWMVVDDVLMPFYQRPKSLKANLEVMLTLQAFNSALQVRNLDALNRYSGDSLQKIAWRQLNEVPESAVRFLKPMSGEIVSMTQDGDRLVVVTQDGQAQASIRFAVQGTNYVVDDVVLQSISPSGEPQSMEMLATLRRQVADGIIGPAAQRRSAIQQASAQAIQLEKTVVRMSTFEPIERAVYTEVSNDEDDHAVGEPGILPASHEEPASLTSQPVTDAASPMTDMTEQPVTGGELSAETPPVQAE